MDARDFSGTRLSRRQFLGNAAGLTFAVGLGSGGVLLLRDAAAMPDGQPIGAWVRITADDRITIITPAAEMGQGSMTSVPVVLAEELDADWSKVSLEMAPAEPEIYGYESRGRKSMGIYGSLATRSYYDQMRLAGAQVRQVLLRSAAEHWGVDAATLRTEPNTVIDSGSGQRLSYGAIASFARIPESMPPVTRDDLKKPADFRLIGKPVPRFDIPEKVDGSAMFSIDVRLPGMVYATTVHAPVQLAQPERWNDAEIRNLRGVVDIVPLDNGVAVIADTFQHALAARDALEVRWKPGAPAEGYDSEQALAAEYSAMAAGKESSRPISSTGNIDLAFKEAAEIHRADYRSDYAYHAQMEPLNAVARFNRESGNVEVWEGTQAPGSSRAAIAAALGLDVSQVVHHQMYMGGGFGRRSLTDYTIEAALIARAIQRPVKMIWTREEDLAFGMFRPQNLQCVEAALDATGNITAWRHCVTGDGGGLLYSGINLEEYYAIPNRQIELRSVSHGIRLKHWRAVAHPFNIFAIECLVDEMAAKAGIDPFQFRRRNLSLTPKAGAVFDAVQKLCDWNAPRPAGRALGLSLTERSGSLGAGVVEISLDDKNGQIRVHKVWAAIDGGTIVQPEMARANVESGIVHGLSSALKERATVRDGAVVQSNFHDYQLLRMAEAPEEIHVEFLDRDAPPTGLGEIGTPFVAAAVANAFHALTGKRLYHMPFTPDRVRLALQAAS